MFEIDEEGFARELERELAGFERRTVDALENAVVRASEITAEAARDAHAYTDRTFALTSSTRALDPLTTGDQVLGGVIADTDYAEHVERSHPFLNPAFERSRARIDAEVERVVDLTMRGGRL